MKYWSAGLSKQTDAQDLRQLDGPFEGLFEGDAVSLFAFKKSQKLAAAVHLVSGTIPEPEPLRASLRKRSLDLLFELLTLRTMPHTIGQTVGVPLSTISEICGLLDVAATAGYVSAMNVEVLSHEYQELGTLVGTHTSDISGKDTTFPDDFFAIAQTRGHTQHDKGHAGIPSKGHSRASIKDTNPKSIKRTSKGHSAALHESRKEHILKLLEQEPRVTIKDVRTALSDCSEKTLQRELVALVKSGILKKEGERRWSTYSRA